MKITSNVYKKLLNTPRVPPEIGGILGSTNNKIIDVMTFDVEENEGKECYYVPNCDYINHCISEWYSKNIYFMGIFHTHADNWRTLSLDDCNYIQSIMNVMPLYVEKLYFPIVFSHNCVKPFVAKRFNNKIKIFEDVLEII